MTNNSISNVSMLDKNESRPRNTFEVNSPTIVKNNLTSNVDTVLDAIYTSMASVTRIKLK